DQHVVQCIAGGVDTQAPRQGQVLDVGAQRVADTGQHGVSAFTSVLDHDIADVVNGVGVVARTTHRRVGARAAVKRVVAAVTDQHVDERIAGGVQVGAAHQRQVLDVGGERVADRAEDRVDTFTGV